jgi:hypothetical protein
LEAHICNLELIAGLDVPLQLDFILGIKVASFNATKSLEDYRIMLERITMAIKWTLYRKQGWEGKGTAAGENSLKPAGQALDRPWEWRSV